MMQAVESALAEARRSPGLDQFRKNPFRALRLAQSATPQQALWQGEKILARVRSGVAIPDPDSIPWLAPASELEIMDAMQTLESPLARVVEQLLWFDFDGDPRGAELRDALAGQEADRLHAYLQAGSEGPLAAQLNQANLRLLVGFSELRGVGPRVLAAAEPASAAPSWTREGSLQVIEDVHVAIRARDTLGASWTALLADALVAWGRLLKHPDVLDEVRARLAILSCEGEQVAEHDAEVVSKAIWARLADLVVGETRLELQRGALENAVQLAQLVRWSEIDGETWQAASRPLRAQFQAELAALEPGAATGGGDTLADIAAYLNRLEVLVARWKSIDTADLVGLASSTDEAAGDAFGRLRALDMKTRLRPEFRTQVERIGALAVSKSIGERASAYLQGLEGQQYAIDALATTTCHFCEKREGSPRHAASLAIAGTTWREGKQYRIFRAWPVPRCERCARLHLRIVHIGHLALVCCLVACALFALLTPMATSAATVLVWGFVLSLGVRFLVRRIVAWFATPRGHRRLHQHYGSRAAYAPRYHGIDGELVYDESYGAWARIEAQNVAAEDGQRVFVAIANTFGRTTAYIVTLTAKATWIALKYSALAALVIGLACVGIGLRFKKPDED